MSWTERWISMARHAASWSKDRSRKVGAVIVNDRNVMVAMGWNGFPRGIDDEVEERHQRPIKYLWSEHAERNALYNAAAEGQATSGCRMFVSMYPCADCARGIVQAGICEVIAVEPDWNDPTYGPDFAFTREMLAEAGVEVRFVPGEHLKRADLTPPDTRTVYNIRKHTRGEFDLHVTVMEEFWEPDTPTYIGRTDETDVMEFEGDTAVEEAKAWIEQQGGRLGEIT